MRHPQDPDPVSSTKSTTVLGLGVLAVVLGPLIGGVIPATVAIVMARQAQVDLQDARGFLLGGWKIRLGVQFAWFGIVLALSVLLVATVIGLLTYARASSGYDFAPDVN